MPNVVITGGQGCLARAMQKEFLEAGWKVEAPGRQELDVSDPASRSRYFAARSPNLLVCAAGMTSDSLLARTSSDAWDRIFQVNYHGAAGCAIHVLNGMKDDSGGHVVFLSSRSAWHPPAGQAAYASAKAALLGLTTALARQYGSRGLRVNALLPGFLETRMTSILQDDRKNEILKEHTLGRYNTCCRVARFVRFLHEEMPHTSGQVFSLDSRVCP